MTDLQPSTPATVLLLRGRRRRRCLCSHRSHASCMCLLQLSRNLLRGAHGARQRLLCRSGRQDAACGGLQARLLLLLRLLTRIGCCSLLLWFVCRCSMEWCISRIQRTLHFLAARGARSPHSPRPMMLHISQTTAAELTGGLPCRVHSCRQTRRDERGTYPQR